MPREGQPEHAFRSSSPPIPALKNKGKKPKPKVNNVRKPSFDEAYQQQSPLPPLSPPFTNNDDYAQLPPIEDTQSQGGQTYRKPPTPRQPGLFETMNILHVVACACLSRRVLCAKKATPTTA